MKYIKNILKGCLTIILSPISFVLLMTVAAIFALFIIVLSISCKFAGKSIKDIITFDIRNVIKVTKDEVEE